MITIYDVIFHKNPIYYFTLNFKNNEKKNITHVIIKSNIYYEI